MDSDDTIRSHPDPGPADPPPHGPGRTALLVAAVAATGLMGVLISVRLGRADSALLFVGVPVLLALALGRLRLQGAGVVFQVVTVVLLLSSALLHEGAICVLLASPIVYGSAFAVFGMVRASGSWAARHALAPVVLVVVALEGVTPGVRVDPVQRAEASTVLAPTCVQLEQALQRGPRPDAAQRGWLLDTAGYPTPTAATGTGLAVGDTWELTSAGGTITTEVVASAPGALDFEVVSDTSKTQRWVGLRGGELRWSRTDEGCRADLAVDYERRLDPGLWFGPVSAVFMDAGARAFLRGLA